MAHISHNLDEYTKQALWVEHKKSCFYCREILEYKNIHVDHVIPSKVFSGNESAVRLKYSLALTFDFNSLDNFVPSCQSCNSFRKNQHEIENGIPLWLMQCSSKKTQILKLAEKIKKSLTLDLPDQYRQYFLSSPDFLLSGVSIQAIRKADIPIYKVMAFHSDYWPLQLTSPTNDDEKVSINNLIQYEEWSSKGYFGLTTPDIAMSSFCEACLSFFAYFADAIYIEDKIPLSSYWAQLPASILHAIGPEEDFSFNKFNTIQDFINANPNIKIEHQGQDIILTIHEKQYYSTETYYIKEILQSSSVGDDEREAIIFIHYKSAGTLNFTYSVLAIKTQDIWKVKSL